MFVRDLSKDMEVDETTQDQQTKGKGGTILNKTTAHFETKRREAAQAESHVQRALTLDDADMASDLEAQAKPSCTAWSQRHMPTPSWPPTSHTLMPSRTRS